MTQALTRLSKGPLSSELLHVADPCVSLAIVLQPTQTAFPVGNCQLTAQYWMVCINELCIDCRSIQDVIDVHRVNVLGPLMVTQAMLPMIRKGKRKLVSTLLSGVPTSLSLLESYRVLERHS